MLPSEAADLIAARTPKINPDLGNGLAVEHMKYLEQNLDSVFKSVAMGFPSWLKYLGCRRCDPLKSYAVVTHPKANRRVYDLAPSHIYLMEYHFQVGDEPPIVRYMHLPYVEQGGILYLSGSRFAISPVLNDRVISVGENDVFVRLLKAKLNVYRESHHYLANGQTRGGQFVWSRIHNNKRVGPAKMRVRAHCTLAHYLFCKYGFTKTFEKFLGFKPVVGGPEVEDSHAPDQWVVCKSSPTKPRGAKVGISESSKTPYKSSELRVAIPRSHYSKEAESLLLGFFYVLDHFPDRILPSFVDDARLWQVLLGHLIWSSDIPEGKLYSDVMEHIVSLDTYMDRITDSQLREIGMPCSDVYELFWLIIRKFNEWITESNDKVNTMYDKELSVLPFVSTDYVNRINQFYFRLISTMSKDQHQRPLTSKEIKELMDNYLSIGLVHQLKKSHGEVANVSTSGDNKALKITNVIVPQTKSSRGQASQSNIMDPALRLHVSLSEVGGFACMPKAQPDGRSRLNLFVGVEKSGLIKRNPKHAALLDRVQEMIRRR